MNPNRACSLYSRKMLHAFRFWYDVFRRISCVVVINHLDHNKVILLAFRISALNGSIFYKCSRRILCTQKRMSSSFMMTKGYQDL